MFPHSAFPVRPLAEQWASIRALSTQRASALFRSGQTIAYILPRFLRDLLVISAGLTLCILAAVTLQTTLFTCAALDDVLNRKQYFSPFAVECAIWTNKQNLFFVVLFFQAYRQLTIFPHQCNKKTINSNNQKMNRAFSKASTSSHLTISSASC